MALAATYRKEDGGSNSPTLGITVHARRIIKCFTMRAGLALKGHPVWLDLLSLSTTRLTQVTGYPPRYGDRLWPLLVRAGPRILLIHRPATCCMVNQEERALLATRKAAQGRDKSRRGFTFITRLIRD